MSASVSSGPSSAPDAATARDLVAAFQRDLQRLQRELGKVIVGHDDIVEGVLFALCAGGHALLEGVPGLGKTLLVRTLADTIDLRFSRIQFTPDLMPADILGTNVIVEDSGQRRFEFQRGPLFANVVLADEVNRATPKTQSALLEAMQERSVTIGKTSYKLDLPFFVLATQNPLEMEGTYPLPEAQLDRFFVKLKVTVPSSEELHTILDRTTGQSMPTVEKILDRGRLLELQELARRVPVARPVQDYVVRIVQATHKSGPGKRPAMVEKYARYGSSPRGAQACLLAAKIAALLDGRFAVSTADIRRVVKPTLRHRVLLSFEGEAEGIDVDTLLDRILAELPEG